MTGVKRIRTENDDQENKHFAPKDYSFNFTPTVKPSQKIFDAGEHMELKSNIDFKPVNYSISTLTHRFRKRAEARQQKRKSSLLYNNNSNSNSHQPQQQNNIAVVTNNYPSSKYEPMYLRHQDISYTIITYLQMTFNIIITVTVLYIFTKIILVIKQDFKLKAQEQVDLIHKEKLACTNHYVINHCGQENQVPAIEGMCAEWLSCMQKDVVVAQAKVSAEAIAEIINSFVEPISYKALAFFTMLILGSLLFSNLAFSSFKRKYTRREPLALEHQN